MLSVPITSSTTITETEDAAGSTSSTYAMTTSDVFLGGITVGDKDWIAVSLTAGTSYRFRLAGEGTLPLSSPLLQLYDASGGLQPAYKFVNSEVYYTATTTGTHYLSAAGFYSYSSQGAYKLTVQTFKTASIDEMADYLTEGYWQDTRQTPRSFDEGTPGATQITVNLADLDADGLRLARMALDAWEAVADLEFTEVTGPADITFDDDLAGAFSNSRALGGQILDSTVNVSATWLASYGTTLDSHNYETYVHEIGHALGLGHLGTYNAGGDAEYSINYVDDARFVNDSQRMSVMSYFNQTENFLDPASAAQPLGPMMADILAIQNLYGAASGSGTAGATTWGRNGSTGTALDVYFAALAGASDPVNVEGNGPVAFTIWDEGGIDIVDLRFDASAQTVDLRAEAFSNVLGGTLNMTIARGTVIENFVAGSGHDIIMGNLAGNSLAGGAGRDRLSGSGGQDVLTGMRGADRLFGGNGADSLRGDVGQDHLAGGSGGDRLAGGLDADTFIVAASCGTDTIEDFTDNLDTLHLDDALWGGGLSVAQVVGSAIASSDGLLFDWGGGNRLTFRNLANENLLLDDITII